MIKDFSENIWRYQKKVLSLQPEMSTYLENSAQSSVLSQIIALGKQVVPQGAHLILYGSQARKDARPDSDWDLLILVDKPKLTAKDIDTISYPFTLLGWQLGEEIHPIMYTKKEWEDQNFSEFYSAVNQDGIQLR